MFPSSLLLFRNNQTLSHALFKIRSSFQPIRSIKRLDRVVTLVLNHHRKMKALQDEPYLILIVFSNLDVVTLFKSCAVINRNWYDTFFSENSVFLPTLCKIDFLNRMSTEMRLKEDMDHVYGMNNDLYTYNDYSYGIGKHLQHHPFSEFIVKQKGMKNPMERERKYITINRHALMLPFPRNPVGNLRFDVCQLFQNKQRARHYWYESCFLGRICVNYMVKKDKGEDGFGFTLCPLFETEEVIFDAVHPFKADCEMSMQLTYQSHMRTHYCKLLNIDPKLECCIYSLYITGSYNSNRVLKKYLLVDKMKGKVESFEEYSLDIVKNPSRSNLCFDWVRPNLWEAAEIDVVAYFEYNNTIKVVCDGMLMAILSCNTKKAPSDSTVPVHHIEIPNYYEMNSKVVDVSIVNNTHACKCEGFGLIDGDTHEKFAVVSIKVAFTNDFERNSINIQTISMIIVKVKSSSQTKPYSYLFKVLDNESVPHSMESRFLFYPKASQTYARLLDNPIRFCHFGIQNETDAIRGYGWYRPYFLIRAELWNNIAEGSMNVGRLWY